MRFTDLTQELFGAFVLRRPEKLLRRPLFDKLASIEEADPVGHVAGKTHLVRDQQHGIAVLGGQLPDDLKDLAYHLGVQGRGRLVKQQDLGLHGQSPGDGDALLLSAGELAGVVVALVGEASYVRKLVTELSGGVFGYLDSVLERHSFDEFGKLI